MNSGNHNEFDVIVAGSGPGGGSVAKELSKQGAKVLILEKGPGTPIKGTPLQAASIAMIPGKSMHFTQQLLGLIHGITVGGSSILYCACAFEPPYDMFDKYGIDLRTEIKTARQDLPIAPLKDDLVGPAARRIMDSARDLGLEWSKLPKMVYQDKCRPNCDKCMMGCPYGAKWTSRISVEEACVHGAVLETKAHVKRVLKDKQGASGIEYIQRGKSKRAFAQTVILAAGGMGTPMILRRSGVKNAGSEFFFDPLLIVMGTVNDLQGGKEFPMAAGHSYEADGYVMADLVLPIFQYWMFTSQVFRFDRLFAHKSTLAIMVKARDELGGHLTRRGGVRKRLTPTEQKRLMHGYARACKILKNAGAKHIFKTWYLATHPGGTVKINDVVDADLKTEIDNLYVCDCSVIPEAWGLPPSLTLIALGKRLANHLSKPTHFQSIQ